MGAVVVVVVVGSGVGVVVGEEVDEEVVQVPVVVSSLSLLVQVGASGAAGGDRRFSRNHFTSDLQ